MVSLGREVYCGALKVREDLTVAGRINGDLTVDGSITAKSKLIGEANNLGELHHNGSVFYIKWSAVHQAASLTTVDASDEVTWATTAAHGLAQNDVVHVSAPPPNPTPITEVNGIPAAELTGTFTVQSATTNTFTVQVATAATSAGTFFFFFFTTVKTRRHRLKQPKFVLRCTQLMVGLPCPIG